MKRGCHFSVEGLPWGATVSLCCTSMAAPYLVWWVDGGVQYSNVSHCGGGHCVAT